LYHFNHISQFFDSGALTVTISCVDHLDFAGATALSTRAIDFMTKLSVPATPNNYTVWFHYALGDPPGLQKTIDILLGNRRKFDATINHDLHNAFNSVRSEAVPTENVPQKLNEIIASAKQFITHAITDSQTQIATLDAVSSRVGPDSDPRPIVKTLISELAKANSRASTLEQKFVETTEQFEKVRVSLADAERRSKTDPLTGLANRLSLEEFLRGALIRAMEKDEPLSIFMIDVDHFKKFNDMNGHLIGDQVLRFVAKVLQDNIRDGDLAVRYGGEELVAVLPGATLAKCEEMAERVRRYISSAKLTRRTSGEEIGKVTVSIGAAQFRLAESAEALIERCDRGLYAAKRRGRNQTVTEASLASDEKTR
jgi:diguanylate cyclase